MFVANCPLHFVELCILILLVTHICPLHAVPLTYDGCISDSANSYQVGGWCFLLYRDSSWAPNTPTQDGAQTACLPHGTLAVGVTYQMLQYFKGLNGPGSWDWIALTQNTSYTAHNQGWYWNTLLPSGRFASFPAIMSNIAWGGGEPDNGQGNETAAIIAYSHGVADVRTNYSSNVYVSANMDVICQFAPRQWRYPKRGHGRFNATSGYQIAQTNTIKLECIRQCHAHPGCISFTFNPTTQDCQIYSVSPEDPRFAGNVIVDSTYDWYIRDGMVY